MRVPSVKDGTVLMNPRFVLTFGMPMVVSAVQGINLFKTAGCSISGWIDDA